MKKCVGILLSVCLLAVFAAPQAHAAIDDNDKPVFSLTPYAGMGLWSDDVGLDDSFIFGGRAAWHFYKSLSLEGTYGRSSANRAADGVGTDLDHYGMDLVWDLMPRARFVPYLTGGWAQIDYNSEGANTTQVLNGAEIGIGLKTRLGGDKANYRALRLDVRDVISNLTPSFPNGNSSTHNFIATVGVQFAFGKSSRDGDDDGVRDRDDSCADTPTGAMVNAAGCPTDSDADGVYDGLDNCEGTPAGAKVDSYGCPLDSDGDGVYDGLDDCDGTPAGAEVDSHGCPIAETEVQLLDTGKITTNKIVFASGSAEIDMAHSAILAEIGETLSHWPELQMEIIGHTDNTGSAAFNQKLSLRRADSVLAYLKANYPDIDTSKYTTTGLGEESPIADNGTAEGRLSNRRVEFKVLNPGDLKREIERRK